MANDTVDFSGDDFIAADLEDVKAWDGSTEPVAAGLYAVEIDEATKAPSAAGNPQVKTIFKIVSKADGGATSEEGRILRGYYQLTGKGRSRLKALLQATGTYKDGGFSVSALKGKRLAVSVTHEAGKYTDKVTMETKDVTNVRVAGERPL